VLRSDGEIRCWGGDPAHPWTTPPAGVGFTYLDGHDNYFCAVDTVGEISCWGADEAAKLAPPAGPFVRLALGERHGCALRPDTTLACWGRNDDGEATPPATSGFSHVAAGFRRSCALASDGSATCWGWEWGVGLSVPGPFTTVEMKGYRACGLDVLGSVACWGQEDDGWTPPAGTGYTALTLGGWSCVLDAAGAPTCWKRDCYTTPGTCVTVEVPGPPGDGYRALTTTLEYACGLRGDGTVGCSGTSFDGGHLPPPDLQYP
jgi:hypothetical protein